MIDVRKRSARSLSMTTPCLLQKTTLFTSRGCLVAIADYCSRKFYRRGRVVTCVTSSTWMRVKRAQYRIGRRGMERGTLRAENVRKVSCTVYNKNYSWHRQTWPISRLDLRRAVSDVCYVEQRDFRALTSAENGWVNWETLAVRIGARRAGGLALNEKGRVMKGRR